MRPQKVATKDGGGGGLNMDTLMPLLLMAAPFLEAHQPGYGLGLVQGVLQHQDEVAQANRNEILTFAKEFANTPPELMPAVRALLKAHGVTPERMTAIEGAFPIFRDPNFALNEQIRKTREFLAPEVAQMTAFPGTKLEDVLSPERLRAAQSAGLQVPADIRTVVPGQAAVPGGGELGRRTPPQAAVPAQERVVARGAAPPPLLMDYIGGFRFRENQEKPGRVMLAALQSRINADPSFLSKAVDIAETSPYIISPKEDRAKFDERVKAVQTKIETMAGTGQLTGDALVQAVTSANAALASHARNAGIQTFQGLDTRMIEAKLPKPESIVMLNTNTGQWQTLTLPAGTKLHTYSPPNAPAQHLLIYPDGRREMLPPGQVPTLVPPRVPVDKVSPADKEVLSIFFNANSYAQLKTRPQAEQDAFGKRFQQALKNIGVNVVAGSAPPPTHPFWDGIKQWLGLGGPAPAVGTPPAPAPAGPARPAPKSPSNDPLGILGP